VQSESRLHDRLLWGLLAVTALGVTAWAGWSFLKPSENAASDPPSTISSVAEFALLERSGRTVTNHDLEGKVWIAAQTFDCCTMSCPKIREAFQQLQEELRQTGVVLVSFSVDPGNDSPDVLRTRADVLQADAKRWLFLTGYGIWDEAASSAFFSQSFLTRPLRNASAEPGQRVAHSSRLYLVDRKGRVRGSYACVEDAVGVNAMPTGLFQINEEELARLRADAEALDGGPLRGIVRLSTLPAVNATLNGTSAVLLSLGYVLIRRRRIRSHATCMISAVAVSAVFLTSYVYYHYYQGHTRFPDVWVRPIYLTLLFSHVILAVAVVPLVLWTLHHAAWGNYVRHRRIARWTLPLWLYVSVTGVLVYLFLYQFYPQ
jgi:uncharacterized membrane protein YozB (DUF420 family)/cytochrome oxidase Cu insertion factor (SCO1/SenC/PrrC family)